MLKEEFLWWVGLVVVVGGANRFSCQTHNQVTLGCFWVRLLLLGLVWGYDNFSIHKKIQIQVESKLLS